MRECVSEDHGVQPVDDPEARGGVQGQLFARGGGALHRCAPEARGEGPPPPLGRSPAEGPAAAPGSESPGPQLELLETLGRLVACRDEPGHAQAISGAAGSGRDAGPSPAPGDVPLDLPRRDLLDAVEQALAREGHLLTQGQRVVISRLCGAVRPAQALYARLLARRPRIFWTDELSYDDVPDPGSAVSALADGGLAWRAERCSTPRAVAEASTVKQLRAAARALGRPVSGRRAQLEERCGDPAAAALLRRPGIVLRHASLLRAVVRLALLDHRGRLDRIVLARLGHRRPASYVPTGGTGMFPRRRAWLRYEQGLCLRRVPCPTDPEPLFRWLEAAPLAPEWRRRHSGRRFAEDLLFETLREQERVATAVDAARNWRRMLDAGPGEPGRVVARLALALGRAGETAAGAVLCDAWLPRLPASVARIVEPTARRLGRSSGVGYRPLPPLQHAPVRRLSLEAGPGTTTRPRYRVRGELHTVEAAVVAELFGHGRLAFHGEGAPWATMFGVIFRDAIFAAVPGMLPGPMLRAPLDLGTAGFRERRADLIDARLREVRQGGAAAVVRETIRRHGAEDIRGVDWGRFPPDALLALASLVSGPTLAVILEAFVDDWRGARRGLPDLCVLPGRPVRLSRARPGRVGADLLLVEVKGPNDSLRPAQRIWLDRLLRGGVRAEVWEVRPEA